MFFDFKFFIEKVMNELNPFLAFPSSSRHSFYRIIYPVHSFSMCCSKIHTTIFISSDFRKEQMPSVLPRLRFLSMRITQFVTLRIVLKYGVESINSTRCNFVMHSSFLNRLHHPQNNITRLRFFRN